MSRTLIKSAVWQKLCISLQVQQKFVHENKNKRLIDRANRRVAHLTWLLEALSKDNNDPVICE